MNVKMREEDRRAIDVLLDRSALAAAKTNGSTVYAAVDENVRRRMVSVEKVLSLLENAVAPDPARHLMDRTLRLVEQASGRPVTDRASMSPTFSSAPPLA